MRVEGVGGQVNFNDARGHLRYIDSVNAEWQTHFRYRTVGSTLRVDVVAAGRTDELGEPEHNADEWVNAPKSVKQT